MPSIFYLLLLCLFQSTFYIVFLRYTIRKVAILEPSGIFLVDVFFQLGEARAAKAVIVARTSYALSDDPEVIPNFSDYDLDEDPTVYV